MFCGSTSTFRQPELWIGTFKSDMMWQIPLSYCDVLFSEKRMPFITNGYSDATPHLLNRVFSSKENDEVILNLLL